MSEFQRVFGTRKSNTLEEMIDGRQVRLNDDNEAQWSRKYAHYASRGSIPDSETLARAERAAIALGNPLRIRAWLRHALWILAAEPVVGLEVIWGVMSDLPRIIRKQIYHLSDRSHDGRVLRQDFERSHAIWLRDRGTLDAFVGLLALAREGEILGNDPKQALSARCAFEIFPLVILDNPELGEKWVDLFEVLKLGFWSRVFHGGICYGDYTLENMAFGLDALSRNRTSKLPWSAGHLRREAKD